jgi:hypothetical protein
MEKLQLLVDTSGRNKAKSKKKIKEQEVETQVQKVLTQDLNQITKDKYHLDLSMIDF